MSECISLLSDSTCFCSLVNSLGKVLFREILSLKLVVFEQRANRSYQGCLCDVSSNFLTFCFLFMQRGVKPKKVVRFLPISLHVAVSWPHETPSGASQSIATHCCAPIVHLHVCSLHALPSPAPSLPRGYEVNAAPASELDHCVVGEFTIPCLCPVTAPGRRRGRKPSF